MSSAARICWTARPVRCVWEALSQVTDPIPCARYGHLPILTNAAGQKLSKQTLSCPVELAEACVLVDAVQAGQDRSEAWMAAMVSGDSRAMLTVGAIRYCGTGAGCLPDRFNCRVGAGRTARLKRMPRGVDQDVPFLVTAFPQPLDDAVDHRRVGHRTGADAVAPPIH